MQTHKKIALELSPLLIFIAISQLWGNWPFAFMVGGGLGLLHLVYSFFFDDTVDYLLVGVDLYMLIGGIAFSMNLFPILRWYQQREEAALFIIITLLGIVMSIVAPSKFLDTQHRNKNKVQLYSFYLVLGSIILTAWAAYFHKNNIIASLIPFLGLYSMRIALRAALARHQ